MITLPNGKICMNEQEAIQWLLNSNRIPFQCTANYAPLTEIGLGTIVNPTPAKVQIGSIIFFADSKVSTVVGITETGFICSDKFNNLVDDIAYVTSVAINGSGHLITTLSDGQTIDAGLIKQVTGFSIDVSQHLIVSFNDGTSEDLGAIFTGNVNIAGNFTADSIIENMTGYGFSKTFSGIDVDFAGVVKNGNKITFAIAGRFNGTVGIESYGARVLGAFTLPSSVGIKIYPILGASISFQKMVIFSSIYSNREIIIYMNKDASNSFSVQCATVDAIPSDYTGAFRYEETFLLSNNLAA